MGNIAQIFNLLNAMEALGDLANGYNVLAAESLSRGDLPAYGRNIGRANDAIEAAKRIGNLNSETAAAAVRFAPMLPWQGCDLANPCANCECGAAAADARQQCEAMTARLLPAPRVLPVECDLIDDTGTAAPVTTYHANFTEAHDHATAELRRMGADYSARIYESAGAKAKAVGHPVYPVM